mgnify:CR=1 FL=1
MSSFSGYNIKILILNQIIWSVLFIVFKVILYLERHLILQIIQMLEGVSH